MSEQLKPEMIKCIGYYGGAFYVSEYEWNDFAWVLRNERRQLTWIGAPGWFAYDWCKAIYEWLSERHDLAGFHEGEWILLREWKAE